MIACSIYITKMTSNSYNVVIKRLYTHIHNIVRLYSFIEDYVIVSHVDKYYHKVKFLFIRR